jgi:hypothetical protein
MPTNLFGWDFIRLDDSSGFLLRDRASILDGRGVDRFI